MSFLFPDIPDPALRQPATLAAVAPVFLGFYAQSVLAILPNTFLLKLSLLPVILAQAWSCVVRLNFSMGLAKWLGYENDAEWLRSWDFISVMAMLIMALRSFEWTFFIKKPLRKYEWSEGLGSPVERPLSVPNVLLDALDLFFNQRGIGWSWSSRPFPRENTPPPSIVFVLAKTLLKLTVLDTSQYILHLLSPAIDKTGGGSLFNANIPLLPHMVSALFITFVRALWVYGQLESSYHVAMLIGRILLRQPASHWPPFFRRPWMATSMREFWSVRWHQFFRRFFIVFGARPGGALLGQPGAVIGAFAMSGLIHIVGPWAAGVTEFRQEGVFFLLMGLGVVLESAFERVAGLPVRGWLGWLWAMGWMLSWGSLSFRSWGRGGIFAIELLPDHLRPGKILVNGAISLFSKCK